VCTPWWAKADQGMAMGSSLITEAVCYYVL